MLLNSVLSPLSLDSVLPQEAPRPAGLSAGEAEGFAALMWQMQPLGQQADTSADTSLTGPFSHKPEEGDGGHENNTALSDMITLLQQWLNDPAEHASPAEEQAVLSEAMERIHEAFSVLSQAAMPQQRDGLDRLMPVADETDQKVVDRAAGMGLSGSLLETDIAANFAADDRPGRSRVIRQVAQALHQLESLLQQRQTQLQAATPSSTTPLDTAKTKTLLTDPPLQADAVQADAEADNDRLAQVENEKQLHGHEGLRPRKGIKAQVAVLLRRLTEGVENTRLLSGPRLMERADHGAVEQLVIQASNTQVHPLQEGTDVASLAQLLSTQHGPQPVGREQVAHGAPAVTRVLSGTESTVPSPQQAFTQEESDHRPMQEGNARAGGVTTGRMEATIQLPLRHPQWGDMLAQRVMVLAQSNQQLAQIRLHPAHLGPIQVKLKVDADSGVQVSLHAHHALTREAIEQAVPRLREMFQQQGLSLSDVTVQPDARGHAQAFADARREQQDGRGHYGRQQRGGEPVDDALSEPVARPMRLEGLIDHFV